MKNEYILVPHSWRRALSVARIILALAMLLIATFRPLSAVPLVRLLLIVFVLYSVVAASWRILERVRFATISLLLDAIFCLIAATIQSEYSVWLSAAFYGYLISSALLIHPWKTVAIVSCVFPFLEGLVQPSNFARLIPVLVLLGALGLVAARNRQLLIDRLIATSRKSVYYRATAQQARGTERERIAADFHDGPQQSFISLQMRLEVIRRLLERSPEKAMAELVQLQRLTKQQVEEVRAFVRRMRPADVDGSSLTVSVSQLIARFEDESGISASLEGDENVELEDQNIVRELLLIVREALHNAQKHSGASKVVVGVRGDDGAIRIEIADDGVGFAFTGAYSLEELDVLNTGPESIKRRVRRLGGELTIESRPGARLRIRVPV